jgi:large subunit ribosomal protein L17
MRHRVAGRKLSRTTEHRVALLRNLSTSLFAKERIQTTLSKAKELRPFAEKLITLSKKETLHARRLVLRDITDKAVVAKLFDTISPRYAQRPGGYTRIIKLGPRRGDYAEMAIIELVGSEPKAPKKAAKKTSRKVTAKKAAKKADDGATSGKAEKKATSKKRAAKKATAKKKAAKKKTDASDDKPAKKATAKKKTAKKKATTKKTAKKKSDA